VNIYVHPRGEHKKIINPYLSRVYKVVPSISIKGLSTNQWTGSIFEKKTSQKSPPFPLRFTID